MSKNKQTKAVKVAASTDEGTTAGWQQMLSKSATMMAKSDKDRKRASAILWDGAKAGIEQWLPGADADESAEKFAAAVTEALGKERKGDASKIKTVALAVKNNGLDLDAQPNLSKAYAEARRLTKVVVEHSEEDEAAEEVISSIDAPKTASTAEAAAKIVLSKGVDEAARLLLDTLGDQNHAAHRSLLRALSQEVAGRVKAEKEAEVEARKAAAEAKRAEREAKAAAKKAEAKAKPKASSKKAAPKTAAPAEAGVKPKPKAKAASSKAASSKAAPKAEPVTEQTTIEGEPASAQSEAATAKPKPVVKKPIIKKPTPKA